MGTILKVAADKGAKKFIYIRAQAQCVQALTREKVAKLSDAIVFLFFLLLKIAIPDQKPNI